MFYVFSKSNIIKGIIFAILGLSFGIFAGRELYFKAAASSGGLCVVVDAGHGEPDGGAVGANGSVEQKINLAVSEKLCEVLRGRGIKVIMTRNGEDGLVLKGTLKEMKISDMRKRLEIIKNSKADLFLSIHMNFFPSESVNGLRFFYNASHPEIKALAEDMQAEISGLTGAKPADVKAAPGSLFLMKNSPVPAILAECGFISNEEEEKKLNDSAYQAKIAWAAAHAIEKYFRQYKQ